jgi:alkylated DNA repair dioxygenase AlkB
LEALENNRFEFNSIARHKNYSKSTNLFPFDGFTNYTPNFFHEEEPFLLHKLLKEIAWKHDELTLYGKKIITKRQVAFEGDEQIYYTYSKQQKIASPWSHVVLELKQKLEKELQTQFNGCLLNLYATGEIGMAWHSDNEPELDTEGIIASLSFGATRTFQLKHKQSGEKIDLKLENGSLVVMDMHSQKHWMHQLKKEPKIFEPRVNLTFRQFRN